MPEITGIYQFGPFRLRAAERQLVREGVEVPLQFKVFEILCLLVEHAGRAVTKADLSSKIWPDTVVSDNNLSKNVFLLRKALGEGATGPCYIETMPRVGYRFIAPVTHMASPASSPAVAVLYFENLSGDKEDEYFCDGVTEDVITELAKIKALRVLSRSAVLGFRDTRLPVARVGQQLRAAFVLEGSIRRADSLLRITARLIETCTGHSMWAERYDRSMEDVFAIQDEIAQSIARALRVMLTEKEKQEIAKRPTNSIQAHDYYLRGRQFFYQLTRQGMEFARQMFAHAIAIDPSYARAHAALGDCCSFLYLWFGKEDDLHDAVSASRRAVALDPQSAEARAALGCAQFVNRNYEDAHKEFETALELNSELFEAYYFYGRSCFVQGQFEKASALFAKASQVNPDDYQAPSLCGLCYRALGRMTEAREAFRESFQRVEHRLQLHPEDVRAVYMGSHALCGLGENARAIEWADRALSLDPEEAATLYYVSGTYALVGESERAIDYLEKAFHTGVGNKEWIEHDPDFASVRSHPRFKTLMRRLAADRKSSTR